MTILWKIISFHTDLSVVSFISLQYENQNADGAAIHSGYEQSGLQGLALQFPDDRCDNNKFLKPSGMIHKSEVNVINKRTAELWLYKADSLVMLTHSVGASSAACLLSALTYNILYACGMPAGGNEQSAEDHLARRRDWETAGLPDVHSIKGRVPSLCCCNVTFMSAQIEYGPELIYSCWTVC